MAKENAKKNWQRNSRDLHRKRTNIVPIRMLIMTGLDILGIIVLSVLHRNAMAELDFVNYWLIPLTIVFGVLTAGSLAFLIIAAVKKIDTSRYPVTPAMFSCVFGFCTTACLIYKSVLPSVIIFASVIATVLFLVYCLYIHVFYR